MQIQGRKGVDRHPAGAMLVAAALLIALAFAVTYGGPARAALQDPVPTAVLPCKNVIALTAVYRINGLIRFEGVTDSSLAGQVVNVREFRSGTRVATTRVRRDGTWWTNSELGGDQYTWLSKFVASTGGETTRWRRLGQAVGIRGRKPVIAPSRGTRAGTPKRTRITLKVSGDSAEKLKVGLQTGCSRYDVTTKFGVNTNAVGVASISLPRPAVGEPFAIYRVSTDDGVKISPPIVVKPAIGR